METIQHATEKPERITSIKLVELIYQFFFSRSELIGLTFQLNVPFDDLPGETLSAKAISLVRYLERRNQLENLIRIIQEQRPSISIPSVFEEFDKRSGAKSVWTRQERLMLMELIANYFSISNLKTTSFDFGIDYEEISYGGNKKEIAFELVNYMHRRGRLNELFETLRQHNPTAAHWDRIFATSYNSSAKKFDRTNNDLESNIQLKR